jgi:hypothetical protein
MTTPPAPPPGWYEDPAGGGARRYWDGAAWGPVEPPPLQSVKAQTPPSQPASNAPHSVESDSPAADRPKLPIQEWWSNTTRSTKLAVGGASAAVLVIGGVSIANQKVEQSKSCPVSAAAGDLKALQDNARYDKSLDSAMVKVNTPGRVGQEVRDGDFAFMVHSIDACPGKPVKVAMTVTNIKDTPRLFRASNQKLLRNAVRPTGPVPTGGYSCSPCDGIEQTFNLNPGDAMNTVVTFDIKGDEPQVVAVVVHDSWLSNGVMVFP